MAVTMQEASLSGALRPWLRRQRSEGMEGDGGVCEAFEECAICTSIYGPPRCGDRCHNFTVVTKESTVDVAEELTQCSGFRAEPQYCFIRWSLDEVRSTVYVPHTRRCVGSPSAVVGIVVGVLLALALVLALGLGALRLPGLALNAWRLRPRRTRSARSASTHSASTRRPTRRSTLFSRKKTSSNSQQPSQTVSDSHRETQAELLAAQ